MLRNIEITISLNDVVKITSPLITNIVLCILFTHSHNFLDIKFSNMFD